MIAAALNDIDAETIEALAVDGRPESPTLDFKRLAPVRGDAGRTEFLKDVCAFANAGGGDLVYGIATVEDAASEVKPLSGDDESADALKRRLVGYLDSDVQPRVTTTMAAVTTGGGYVLIVRVPASFVGPHRFRDHGPGRDHHRFVVRSGTRIADMDYTQLRSAFDRTATLAESARSFRAERLEHLAAWQTTPPLRRGPLLVMHMLPLSGVGRSDVLDVPDFYRNGPRFVEPGGYQPQKFTNLDGVLVAGPPAADQTLQWQMQVFRSGAFEFARHSMSEAEGQPFLHSLTIGRNVRRWLDLGMRTMQSIGVTGPVLLGLSFMHVGALPFKLVNDGLLYGSGIAGRAHAALAEHWVEDASSYKDSREDSKAVLDALWQCFGEVECDMFLPGHEWAVGQSYSVPHD